MFRCKHVPCGKKLINVIIFLDSTLKLQLCRPRQDGSTVRTSDPRFPRFKSHQLSFSYFEYNSTNKMTKTSKLERPL